MPDMQGIKGINTWQAGTPARISTGHVTKSIIATPKPINKATGHPLFKLVGFISLIQNQHKLCNRLVLLLTVLLPDHSFVVFPNSVNGV